MKMFKALRKKWRLFRLRRKIEELKAMRDKCRVGTIQRTVLDSVIPVTEGMYFSLRDEK